jgi:TolA-binding protein
MPVQERNNLISGIINNIMKAESEGKISEFASRYSLGQYYENERRYQGNIEQEGKWYFYNQSALTFGRSEFRRRWGDRPLEDNWRRINKAVVTISQQTAEGDDLSPATSDSSGTELDYKKPEFYLKSLPLTDSLKAVSNEKIANAYLSAGKAYSEKLGDKQRANESFEKLLERFPGNELVPEALYNLYRVNKDFNNARGESYRQRLLEKHPETEFAKILSDPAYYEKKFAEMKLAEQTYEKAFSLYINEDFNGAVTLCDESLQKFPNDQLAPKFMLLRAYSFARIQDERYFKEELEKVIKSWPETEESKKAAEIIAYLNQENPELKFEEEKEIAGELYFADTTSIHIFAVVIGNPQANLNQAAFDIISYNIDNYTNNNYKTIGELLDNKYVIITVSGFRKYREILNYFNSFDIDRIVRNPTGYKIYKFILSEASLKTLKNDNNPDRYYLFFREQYLKEIINP